MLIILCVALFSVKVLLNEAEQMCIFKCSVLNEPYSILKPLLGDNTLNTYKTSTVVLTGFLSRNYSIFLWVCNGLCILQ